MFAQNVQSSEQTSLQSPLIQPKDQRVQERNENDGLEEDIDWSSDEDGSAAGAGIALGLHYPGATINRNGDPTWPLRSFARRIPEVRDRQ